MDWTKQGNVWRSGSYVIERVGANHWWLTRIPPTSSPLVRAESMWSGRSLRLMKAQAERIESRRANLVERRRYLGLTALAFVLFLWSASLPGAPGVLGVIVSWGLLLLALTRLIDRIGQRPWDALKGNYQ